MSNYLSKSYQVQAPADYSSTEVGAKVAYAMQGKYDQNKAIIDQTLASYNSQLKGLRDTDNEYISAKLKEVKSAIDLNSQKNGDLSKSYNKDSILSAITSVMDDPIIQDAVISAQNGKNLDNQYQELLKKDPKLANTGNYQDAKDLGGYSDYMAGKSKVLGKMELTPYTDVVGELHKRAKEYAKDYGLQERYLGSDQTNPYYYEDKYGKVLTKTEVYNFLNSTLTVPERKQLQIDTRQSLGKTDEATYSKFAKNYYNDEITSSQSELAQLKAKRDTAADKTGYNKLIAEVDDKIKDYKTKSASSQIDKGDMYDIYNKTTLNNISSSYDIDIITKIDRDHLPLDIMKFQSDVAFHKEDLRLKQEANDLKKKENQISQQIAGGTPIVKETPPEESEDSDMTKIRRETARTATALDMYLTEHIEEYKDMSESEKWDYKLHYNPSDLTVKGNTSTAKVLANEFQTAQKGFANIVDDADNKIKSQVKNSFNDLSGGSANIDNLKNTMPLTASIIKGKKGIQFESLSEPIKKGLVAEWAANKLQYSSPSDEDVRNMYAKVIIKNKVALQKVGGGESNYVLNTIKESSDIEKVRNPFSSALEASARVFKNVVIDPFTEANADIGRRLFFGESYANEKEKEYLQTQHQDWKTINKVGNEFGRGITDYFNPSQDTNITELEARDLAVRKGKTSTDVNEAFHNLDGSLNTFI